MISSPHPWQERSELWNLDVRLHTLQSRLNQTLTQAEVMKDASGPPPAAEANETGWVAYLRKRAAADETAAEQTAAEPAAEANATASATANATANATADATANATADATAEEEGEEEGRPRRSLRRRHTLPPTATPQLMRRTPCSNRLQHCSPAQIRAPRRPVPGGGRSSGWCAASLPRPDGSSKVSIEQCARQ